MSERPKCCWCRQRPEADEFRPFCSKRCKMADLSQWLDGRYRVPGAAPVDTEDVGDDVDPSDSSPAAE